METCLKNDKFEISCRTINTILKYLRQEDKDITAFLEGLPCDEKYLSDTNNWISRQVENEIFRRLAQTFADEDILYKIALASIKLRSLGFLDHVARLIANPEFILRQAAKLNTYFTKIHELEIVQVKKGSAVIKYTVKPGYTMTRYDCSYTRGLLTVLPQIWGSQPAKVQEESCAVPIQESGSLHGSFYRSDAELYLHQLSGQEDKIIGKLGPGGTFKLNGTLYGSSHCLYRIQWSPRKMWMKKVFYNFFIRPKVLEEAIEEMQRENDLIEHKYEELFMKNLELQKHYVDTISTLICAIDAKDHYTQDHSLNVSLIAEYIAKKLDLDPAKIETIKQACKLHDLGKIGIKDSILLKPDKLTDEEWKEIKKHPVLGAQIIKPLTFLSDVAVLVRQDHERWDGSGYPDGLKENQIDIGARVIMLADAYDAMVSGRVYRKRMTRDQALEEIEKNKGTQFDPQVVEVFLKLLQENKTF